MAEIEPLKRRLKSLDEFETPNFVGRMARVERRRKLAWWAMMTGAVAIGDRVVRVLISKLSPET